MTTQFHIFQVFASFMSKLNSFYVIMCVNTGYTNIWDNGGASKNVSICFLSVSKYRLCNAHHVLTLPILTGYNVQSEYGLLGGFSGAY